MIILFYSEARNSGVIGREAGLKTLNVLKVLHNRNHSGNELYH